jgi:type II restriction enzyme
VKENIKNIEIDLNTLDYLVQPKNEKELNERINTLFKKHPEVFKCLEILVAKRDKGEIERYFYDVKTEEVKKYSLETLDDIKYFIKETDLLIMFQSIKNINDYVFGVEVGMNTNANKNITGKINKNAIGMILNKHKMDFFEKKKIGDFISISKKIDSKEIDFIFDKNGIKYFIKTNFYNGGGTMILTSLETNINLNKNFDNKKNKFI